MNENEMLNKIEEYVDFLGDCLKKDVSNIRKTENISGQYKANKPTIDHYHYVRSGDIHYFASRVLFLSGVCEYSFFSAQQCIELYLKGYLKFRGITPPDGHILTDLVNECRKANVGDDFVDSERLVTIAERFNPFYEYARYPIQKSRPENGTYSFVYPDDIKPLDYFVYKMREVIHYPDNTYDVLKEGKLIGPEYNEHCANANQLFRKENINFS